MNCDSQTFKGLAPSQGPTKASVTTSSHWIQGSLETHNIYRSMHSAPPLVLNKSLSEISQYYANYLLNRALQDLSQDRGVYFDHNSEAGKNKIGENLYYSISVLPVEPVPSHLPVQLWYEEFKDYDFYTAKRKPTSDPKAKIGHLTQILWKSTTQMGTAYASKKLKDDRTIVFVVANYYPSGNWVQKGNVGKLYFENVFPSIKSDADLNAQIIAHGVERLLSGLQTKTETPNSWKLLALKQHNNYRAFHGVPPLRLNENLCKVSQLWAEHLLERGLQSFNPKGILDQIEWNFIGDQLANAGESSLFYVTGSDKVSAIAPVKSWYHQNEPYNYESSPSSPGGRTRKSAGFEQIIWSSTTEFCLSYASKVAQNGQYLTYIVANYYPKRIESERSQNIFKPSGDKTLVDVEEELDGGSSFGITVAIILCVTLTLIAVIGGSFFLVYKFKPAWYDRIVLKR